MDVRRGGGGHVCRLWNDRPYGRQFAARRRGQERLTGRCDLDVLTVERGHGRRSPAALWLPEVYQPGKSGHGSTELHEPESKGL